MDIRHLIEAGETYIGIEFGSTRIKAVLTDAETYSPIASGAFEWESKLENGYWTYSVEEIHKGLRDCYASLAEDIKSRWGVVLKKTKAIGISGMMHGYMAFDRDNRLLVPFRTWRNTTTKDAADILTEEFGFNIPQRWSIAHLYQAVLSNESHVEKIAKLTTLAGYIHFLLSGVYAVGTDEASGMFPLSGGSYDENMLAKFGELVADRNYPWRINDILPRIFAADTTSGVLTKEGAEFIDPTGNLESGIPLCPPEGDAGTGMVATNSVRPRTGNISAGTSVFSMLVQDRPLRGIYPEIDIVATPNGAPVAMVHCNNCCSELDEWVEMFREFTELVGAPCGKAEAYERLYKNALNGASDCGGITAYNFISGEPAAGVENGAPLCFRPQGAGMSLANFFRAQIYSAFSALRIGMDILFDKEGLTADRFLAHGGLFKVRGVAQQFLADALKTPISVMSTAGEGGAWGAALLAAYSVSGGGKTLEGFLDDDVFGGAEIETLAPSEDGAAGYERYFKMYKAGLAAQSAASIIKEM